MALPVAQNPDSTYHPRLQDPSTSLGSDVATAKVQNSYQAGGLRHVQCLPSVAWSQLSSVLPNSHVGMGGGLGLSGCIVMAGPGNQAQAYRTRPALGGQAEKQLTQPSNHREQALGEQEIE